MGPRETSPYKKLYDDTVVTVCFFYVAVHCEKRPILRLYALRKGIFKSPRQQSLRTSQPAAEHTSGESATPRYAWRPCQYRCGLAMRLFDRAKTV